eukprot:TRINITY_DN6732_c0_g1_i1.p1 TRINITY_DN6732_c0_g1~~TRINITY_DN6732_c0_g1_i1.p1  ORF type:complete len:535 (+),score=97.91 TRINITY_DN6732_c0_g1_i1:90-1607(+)
MPPLVRAQRAVKPPPVADPSIVSFRHDRRHAILSMQIGSGTLRSEVVVKDTSRVSLGSAADVDNTSPLVPGSAAAVNDTNPEAFGRMSVVDDISPVAVGPADIVDDPSAAVVEDTSTVAFESAAVVEGTSPVALGPVAFVDDTNPAALGSPADVEDTSPVAVGSEAVVQDTASFVEDTCPVAFGSDAVVEHSSPVAVGAAAIVEDKTPAAVGPTGVVEDTSSVAAVVEDTLPQALASAAVVEDNSPEAVGSVAVDGYTSPVAQESAVVDEDTSRVSLGPAVVGEDTNPMSFRSSAEVENMEVWRRRHDREEAALKIVQAVLKVVLAKASHAGVDNTLGRDGDEYVREPLTDRDESGVTREHNRQYDDALGEIQSRFRGVLARHVSLPSARLRAATIALTRKVESIEAKRSSSCSDHTDRAPLQEVARIGDARRLPVPIRKPPSADTLDVPTSPNSSLSSLRTRTVTRSRNESVDVDFFAERLWPIADKQGEIPQQVRRELDRLKG